ncbi:MAG: efflux RND transporter periplasmic adaptor subunit [Algoriphagus sp.]|nr:efflux RND transporter periplasmic adaptor subunit [Algoriphagus sp.]
MTRSSLLMVLFIFSCLSCTQTSVDEQDLGAEASALQPLAYTLYSDKTELFVEFRPLVVGSISSFAAHFTLLGENFLPLTEGKVTVSLVVGEKGIRATADSASSPGIFRLALNPNTAGTGKLIFDIITPLYTDQIVIDNITIYPDVNNALERQQPEPTEGDLITYLKEQAWKVEFANALVVRQDFTDVIKTHGQLLSAPGDERMVTANAGGTVQFSGTKTLVGSEVNSGTGLFIISGGNVTDGNIDAAYIESKANYEKAKLDFERSSILVKDQIISQKDFLQTKLAFENAQTAFNTIGKNYTAGGQRISSPISGFVKNILVTEGQYVAAGTPLAVISKNKKLVLQANISQKYFNKLPSINAANFQLAGVETVFDTKQLNGKVISYGRSTSANAPFIPITFEIDNIGDLIPGSAAEVYLKSTPFPNSLVVPASSLMEEQGNYYVYVQTAGESFQKREVKIGLSDGINVQLLSGVSKGERVVSKGAYQIKLSSASGELPAHGHEH